MGRKPKNNKTTKLKNIMLKKNLSRKELVDIINTISRICTGSRIDYKISTLLRLCKALKVTPNDLIDYEHLLQKNSIDIQPKEIQI